MKQQHRKPVPDSQNLSMPNHASQTRSTVRPDTYPSSQYSRDQSPVSSATQSMQRLSMQNQSPSIPEYNTTSSRSNQIPQPLHPPPARSPPLPPFSSLNGGHQPALTSSEKSQPVPEARFRSNPQHVPGSFSSYYDEPQAGSAGTGLAVPFVKSGKSSISATDDEDDAAKFHDANEYEQYLIKDSPNPIPFEAIPLDMRNTADTSVHEKIAKGNYCLCFISVFRCVSFN